MKKYIISIALAILLAQANFAQNAVVEDFKPSAVNQQGKQFPQVNSEGRVRAQISANEAKKFSSILAA
jgi:hypothetical protein